MSFCNKCGNQLAAGAKFCGKCGTAVMQQTTQQVQIKPIEPATDSQEKRKQIYVGEVRKCPNCGSVLESFAAVCSSCGFELSNKKVSDTITNFIHQLNEIRDEPNEKAFWTSWSGIRKAGFIFLNLFTWGIPLGIQIILNLFSAKKITQNDKMKKNMIENFVVPNNKEDIMEFLLFAKTQRDKEYSIFDTKAGFWISTWNNKCEQIIEKASALFMNDSKFMHSINEQKALSQTIKQKRRKRSLILFLFAMIGILGLPSFLIIKNKISFNRAPLKTPSKKLKKMIK